MAVFNFPQSSANAKGMLLTQIGSDNTVTITEFPANTSAVVTTLKTAPDPVTVFQGTSITDADTATDTALHTLTGV